MIRELLAALAAQYPTPSAVLGEGVENVGLKCMALAVYHEARSKREPFWGRVTVAQVVLERGGEVCDTVFSGAFSGLHAPYTLTPWNDEPAAWSEAVRVAEMVLAHGLRNPNCPGVNSFHADWVSPGWSGYVCTEGGHLFYKR